MNWQLRSIAEIRVGQELDQTTFISGKLHGPDRCTCSQCIALESTAAMVAELLRPGESRQIAIPDSPLFLIVKRHRFPPSAGRVKCHRAVDERSNAIASRGRGFTLLRR